MHPVLVGNSGPKTLTVLFLQLVLVESSSIRFEIIFDSIHNAITYLHVFNSHFIHFISIKRISSKYP